METTIQEKKGDYIIGISGQGFVGGAINKGFIKRGIVVHIYDKYKDGMNTENDFKKMLNTDFIFLCLPTLYSKKNKCYDKSAIYENCEKLEKMGYTGLVVIKSTVEPNIVKILSQKYNLKFIMNPEFLSAKTAVEDFDNQKHIVIGIADNLSKENKDVQKLLNFYETYFPDAEISVCTSTEASVMKIFCNTFYSVKIQIFNEFYLLCKKMGVDYDNVKELMLKNGWVNKMHTKVPCGGKLSFGGFCFTKDTQALNQFMIKNGTRNMVLDATVKERNQMRPND